MLYIVPKTPHDFTHIPNVRFVVRLATLCNAILLLNVRYVRLRPLPGKKKFAGGGGAFPSAAGPCERASDSLAIVHPFPVAVAHSQLVGRSALVKFLWKCAAPLLSLSPSFRPLLRLFESSSSPSWQPGWG